ncbi:hypothetical protein EVAR_64151_1 [Eumeta japonica]|uniref:Uncharacterized protein n=1 Tax=Eumeta variegata TaxID=151549 RepID=A0A4C1ZWY1_EUMVA|nr:hypothetical protein EVAR_64151_1 [Eumeta japonica]
MRTSAPFASLHPLHSPWILPSYRQRPAAAATTTLTDTFAVGRQGAIDALIARFATTLAKKGSARMVGGRVDSVYPENRFFAILSILIRLTRRTCAARST